VSHSCGGKVVFAGHVRFCIGLMLATSKICGHSDNCPFQNGEAVEAFCMVKKKALDFA